MVKYVVLISSISGPAQSIEKGRLPASIRIVNENSSRAMYIIILAMLKIAMTIKSMLSSLSSTEAFPGAILAKNEKRRLLCRQPGTV